MNFLRNYLDDLFYWLGALLISAGAYLANPAYALISGGVFCMLFSILIGKARSK
jgi:hypothetical protein